MSVARRTFVFLFLLLLNPKMVSAISTQLHFFCFCLITRALGNCLTLPAQPASLGRPTRELHGINAGHSCSLPHGCPLSTEGCLMKVVPRSSGGSKNTHRALPFSSCSQVAFVAHKKGHRIPWSGGEKMSPDKVDCGNDWCSISVSWPILSAA